MSRLTDLADETLVEIFSHCRDEWPYKSLCNVSLVSKRLKSVATSMIYRDIELSKVSPETSRSQAICRQFDLFSRTIEENPGIAACVRSLNLRIETEAEAEIKSLLERLTLQRIEIDTNVARPFTSKLFQLSFFGENKLERLSYARFRHSSMDVNDVVKLMTQYSITHLTVVDFIDSQIDPSFLEHSLERTSSVTTLDLGHSSSMEKQKLNSLLLIPRGLKSLSFATRVQRGSQEAQMKCQISPRTILKTILPTKETLAKLEIYDMDMGPHRSGHDGSRLSLKEFRSLKSITLPSNLIFRSPEAHPSRDGVYELLPQSVEEFKVIFPVGNGLLTIEAIKGLEPIPVNRIEPSDLHWVEQLATFKPTHLPHLHYVYLGEQCNGPYRISQYQHVKFFVPRTIQRAFDENSVRLNISTRTTRDYAHKIKRQRDYEWRKGLDDGPVVRVRPLRRSLRISSKSRNCG